MHIDNIDDIDIILRYPESAREEAKKKKEKEDDAFMEELSKELAETEALIGKRIKALPVKVAKVATTEFADLLKKLDSELAKGKEEPEEKEIEDEDEKW